MDAWNLQLGFMYTVMRIALDASFTCCRERANDNEDDGHIVPLLKKITFIRRVFSVLQLKKRNIKSYEESTRENFAIFGTMECIELIYYYIYYYILGRYNSGFILKYRKHMENDRSKRVVHNRVK